MAGNIDHDRAAALVDQVAALVAEQIAQGDVKPAGKLKSFHDGAGVYFVVDGRPVLKGRRPTASWVYRYSQDGKARMMGLGAFPAVTPSKARKKAEAARGKRIDGQDPLAEREAKRAARVAARVEEARRITFKEAAVGYIKSNEAGWKNPKHAAQWGSTLETYVYPILGRLPVGEIETLHALQVLEQMVDGDTFWNKRGETARRVRGRCEVVWNWARLRGYCSGENPFRWKGKLDQAGLGKQAAPKGQPSLPYGELHAFLEALEGDKGTAAQALRFLIFTAARPGMVTGNKAGPATWREVDLKARMWTVPADRMKGEDGVAKEHKVPLSSPALAVLEALPKGGPDDAIFLNPTGGPLGEAAMGAVIKRLNGAKKGQQPKWVDPYQGNRPVVPHGFRSTFSTAANDRSPYDHRLIDKALAHALPNEVEAAYNRADMIEKRANLMQWYADFAAKPPSPVGDNIVPLHEFRAGGAA